MMEPKDDFGLMQALSEHRFIRFCLVGGVAFLIDAGCAWGFLKFLPKVPSLALSYLLSCIFHYTCSKHWTFRDPGRISARQVWAYTWVNLTTLITNTTISAWLLQALHQNVFLAKAGALPPTSVLGFFLLRWFVFHTAKPSRR